jgi:hypothetical protein
MASALPLLPLEAIDGGAQLREPATMLLVEPEWRERDDEMLVRLPRRASGGCGPITLPRTLPAALSTPTMLLCGLSLARLPVRST